MFLRAAIKEAYNRAINFLPIEQSIILQFYRNHGYFPDLKNPSSFSEKIQYRKLYDDTSTFYKFTDKLLVKDYVRELAGEQYVIPTIWSGKKLPPRSERSWSRPFVVKSNHGSGSNIFVREN